MQSSKKVKVHKKSLLAKRLLSVKTIAAGRAHADQKFAESSYFAHLHGKCKIFAKAIDKSIADML